MRKLTLLGLIMGVFALAGCNTVKGVGEDMEKVGGKISDAADRTGGTGTN